MIERDPLYFRLFLFVFWALASWGFITQELLPFMTPLGSVLFLFCDIILVILGLVTLNSRRDRIYFATFFIIAIITTLLVNKSGFVSLINGSREYIGMLLAVPLMRYLLTTKRHAEFKARFDKHLLIFLYIQAFCITWQFIKYGANDHGGGSMGNGYSGIASMMIYFISFYLISQKWDRDNYVQSLKDNKLYIILLYPTMLNETKSSFVLLALYFILLYRFEWQKIGKLIMLIPVLIIIGLGLAYAYLSATEQDADTVGSESFFVEYLIGEDTDKLIDLALKVQDEDIETDNLWVVDIPRFTKIFIAPEVLSETNGGMLLGAGIGQFKGGTNLAVTRFATQNKWILQGSRPWLFCLLIEFGLIGSLWFFANFFSILQMKVRPYEMSKLVKLYLVFVMILILFYDDAFLSPLFCIGLFYVALASSYFDNKTTEQSHGR